MASNIYETFGQKMTGITLCTGPSVQKSDCRGSLPPMLFNLFVRTQKRFQTNKQEKKNDLKQQPSRKRPVFPTTNQSPFVPPRLESFLSRFFRPAFLAQSTFISSSRNLQFTQHQEPTLLCKISTEYSKNRVQKKSNKTQK